MTDEERTELVRQGLEEYHATQQRAIIAEARVVELEKEIAELRGAEKVLRQTITFQTRRADIQQRRAEEYLLKLTAVNDEMQRQHRAYVDIGTFVSSEMKQANLPLIESHKIGAKFNPNGQQQHVGAAELQGALDTLNEKQE